MTVPSQNSAAGAAYEVKALSPERVSPAADVATGSKLAGVCCLLLGTGMIIWAVCWVAIERIVAGHFLEVSQLARAGLPVLAGGAFVLLYLLIRCGVRWALCAAFLASSALAAATAISLALMPRGLASIFTLLLAGAAAVSAFYALASRSRPVSQA